MIRLRREKLKIYGDLLAALNEEAKAERLVLTRVQAKTNVPFDRLKKYIAELVSIGLIQDEASLKLTEKGKQFLREYQKMLIFMRQMGFIYRE
jgi:predicted transcriptional regulator